MTKYKYSIVTYIHKVDEKIDFEILPHENLGTLLPPIMDNATQKLEEAIANSSYKNWEAISHAISFQPSTVIVSFFLRRPVVVKR
jgi:hypothetical protein